LQRIEQKQQKTKTTLVN